MSAHSNMEKQLRVLRSLLTVQKLPRLRPRRTPRSRDAPSCRAQSVAILRCRHSGRLTSSRSMSPTGGLNCDSESWRKQRTGLNGYAGTDLTANLLKRHNNRATGHQVGSLGNRVPRPVIDFFSERDSNVRSPDRRTPARATCHNAPELTERHDRMQFSQKH